MRAEVKLHSTSSTAHTKIREDADDVRRMMLILISEAISNSNAVIRREFGKLRFQMIDDNKSILVVLTACYRASRGVIK